MLFLNRTSTNRDDHLLASELRELLEWKRWHLNRTDLFCRLSEGDLVCSDLSTEAQSFLG